MCSKIAFIIQGKSSPHYKPNFVEFKDKCIILNAKYAYLTGKKLTQKYYKYHTGYPGGLKSIRTKDYLERNPKEMILTSIKGMLPKNKMRPDYLSKVEIIPEGGHDYIKLGLPQFGKMHPLDYNEIFGFKNMNPENTVITHSTYEQNNIPERFKNFKHVYDETLTKPRYMITPKISEDDRKTMKYEKYASRDRFMQYRNIRNKGYRFI
jgi:large subunit ribosomal protein L13